LFDARPKLGVRHVLRARNDAENRERIADDTAEQCQHGAENAERLIDSLADGSHRIADDEADADRHPADLIAGDIGDDGPNDGAYERGRSARGEPAEETLLTS
jgi:hypothetical protein